MELSKLIEAYAEGPQLLRNSVAGLTQDQLDRKPIPGKWSTREVVCHLADFEPIYADRMKRVIAEHEPTLLSGDPDVFASRLAYANRDVEEELSLIDLTRRQLVRILRTLKPVDFQRRGIHSMDGPLTLETLLMRIAEHIPHHVRHIDEKRQAMT